MIYETSVDDIPFLKGGVASNARKLQNYKYIALKSILYKKRPTFWVEAKNLQESPPVSALFQRGNFCKIFASTKFLCIFF